MGRVRVLGRVLGIDCQAMNNCRRVESERNNNEENGQDRVMLLMEGVGSHGDWGETSPI